MATRKTYERYSEESLCKGETDKRGRLFVSPLGQSDFRGVHILHSGVDTVRQLYAGTPHMSSVELVQGAYEAGFKEVVELQGVEFLVGSGGKSGYRWRLQNSDLGLIILYGSRHVTLEKEGAHLKMELSPHLIAQDDPKGTQKFMDAFASELLSLPKPSGCAVHLAVDFQGWEPPKDFEERFVTRGRRKVRFDGVIEFDVRSASAVYGERETFMWGSAGALQFSLYRKDIEARKRDKWDYWTGVWRQATDVETFPETVFHPTAPVWRAEARFHHSVVSEFAETLKVSLASYEAVAVHLTGLWIYALDAYRLDASRTYIDPFWQLLREDVQFLAPARDLVYRRTRKTPGVGNEKNLMLALGNMLSVYARHGFRVKRVMGYLRSSGMWSDLMGYAYERQMSPSEFEQWIAKGLSVRRLMGKAA